MFYGGSGLIAGLSGLIAVGTGIFLGAASFGGLSGSAKRYLLTALLIILTAVIVAFVMQFFPS
jgi:hypothetical protein